MIALLFCLAAASATPPPPPLTFNHLPLGSAARVVSARFQVPITLRAGAQVQITGDFSALSLAQTIAALAKQAGLSAVAQDGGYVLGLAAPAVKPPEAKPAPAVSTAERRAELLRRRAALLEQCQR